MASTSRETQIEPNCYNLRLGRHYSPNQHPLPLWLSPHQHRIINAKRAQETPQYTWWNCIAVAQQNKRIRSCLYRDQCCRGLVRDLSRSLPAKSLRTAPKRHHNHICTFKIRETLPKELLKVEDRGFLRDKSRHGRRSSYKLDCDRRQRLWDSGGLSPRWTIQKSLHQDNQVPQRA